MNSIVVTPDSQAPATPPIQLRLKAPLSLPLEAENLAPDILSTLPQEKIRALPLYYGNRRHRLDDFFEISGEKSTRLELYGDLAKVKRIGQGMSCGSITIRGNAGMHCGARMTGGTISVHGDAGDWLGAEMTDGLIRIHGNAANQAGAAYRGNLKGMQGGAILIDGNAGFETGMRMRRGLLYVGGSAGDFTGCQMLGGTIVLCGQAGLRTGAGMSRGTILAFKAAQLLPTFIPACTYSPIFLALLMKQLQSLQAIIPFPPGMFDVQRYTGDTSGLGKGEILFAVE